MQNATIAKESDANYEHFPQKRKGMWTKQSSIKNSCESDSLHPKHSEFAQWITKNGCAVLCQK